MTAQEQAGVAPSFWKTVPGQLSIAAMIAGVVLVALALAGVIGPRAEPLTQATVTSCTHNGNTATVGYQVTNRSRSTNTIVLTVAVFEEGGDQVGVATAVPAVAPGATFEGTETVTLTRQPPRITCFIL